MRFYKNGILQEDVVLKHLRTFSNEHTLFVNSEIVEAHKIELYGEFSLILVILGAFLLIVSIGLFFASILIGVIVAIVGLVLIIFGLRKNAALIDLKKKVYYRS